MYRKFTTQSQAADNIVRYHLSFDRVGFRMVLLIAINLFV